MEGSVQTVNGVRVAVEGCGHGTLNAIYASIEKACEARKWDGVDVLIIGGDFQAVRNAYDLTVMSCPPKYREIGDFHEYYSGSRKAPYLTIFVGGNHEASSHSWELYYGGWVAPNIYYMGAANVVRLGPLRIAGMSGIWKGYNYNKSHYERLPYNQDDIKSIYHVRELDVRKLLQLRTQIDIGISHDWPRAIEKHGNERQLFRAKPDFEQESKDGSLGNLAASYLMDRLRPPYWFAAHMHCKFSATKTYQDTNEGVAIEPPAAPEPTKAELPEKRNTDEIDLDLEDDDDSVLPNDPLSMNGGSGMAKGPGQATAGIVPDSLRAILPASFARVAPTSRPPPGQPPPPAITNKTVRFLALDKCLPGRQFLQLLDVPASESSQTPATAPTSSSRHRLQYDPEWLAITRVFASNLTLGNRNAASFPDLGEEAYLSQIQREEAWVEEHITKAGKLNIPENFEITAPVHAAGMPESVDDGPLEYNNPQTAAFCELIGIENKFFATPEERESRFLAGPTATEQRRDGGFGGGRGRFNGGRGGRGGQRGRGRGRAW